MKKYEPKQMVASSRYKNYFPTLSAPRQSVWAETSAISDLYVTIPMPVAAGKGAKAYE